MHESNSKDCPGSSGSGRQFQAVLVGQLTCTHAELTVTVTSEIELSKATRTAWLVEFGGFLSKSKNTQRRKAKNAGSKPVMVLIKTEILATSVES